MIYDYEGNQVQATSGVDKTLLVSDMPADSKTVGDILYIGEDSENTNLYTNHSETMLLGIGTTSFSEGSTLYGFYVPVDPSISKTVTVQRVATGERFRVVATENVPAVGTTFSSDKRIFSDTASRIVYNLLGDDDRYLYVAYYSSSLDSLTEQELLAGMTIYYGEEYEKRSPRIDRLDREVSLKFVNGKIKSDGTEEVDSKSIVSDKIQVSGTFGVSCSDDYIMRLHLYDTEGVYKGGYSITDAVNYPYWFGSVRFCIEANDESDITPETVDYSQIKIPKPSLSPMEFTNEKSFVLDAENCQCSDVYDYIDSVVSAHGLYASKTYLCTETSGLPVYYYTLGDGAKKLCIVSGQHGPSSNGDPRDSVITVAKMVHDLIDTNFEDNSFLQKLHDDYTILVIPILNGYGFNHRSRTDANSQDTNRDWTTPSSIEVTAAKALISTFDPDIAFDVHCNGTTPVANENVEIQFGLGATYNPLYKAAIQSKFKSYYNTDVAERLQNTTDTLQYYIQSTLGIPGGLLELRWWLKDKKALHDYQTESANYAMLVNIIKYCASVNDSETFVFEKTPNQNQY